MNRPCIISLFVLLLCGNALAASSKPTSLPATKPVVTAKPSTKSTTWCRKVFSKDLYQGKAEQVLASSKRVVLLQDQRRWLSVLRTQDGKLLWKKVLQKKANGVHSLHAAGDYVVVYAGNRLFSFRAKDGVFGGQRVVRLHRHIRNTNGCTFVFRRGVCAFSCGDEYKLLNCQTMFPMSDTYSLTQTCFSKRGCFSFRGQPFGKVGSLLMTSVEEPKRLSGQTGRRRQVVLAVHQKTGRVVWESLHNSVLLWMLQESGISPDQKTCWMANYAGDMSVFDCQTGKELWHRSQLRSKSPLTVVHRMIRWQAKPQGFVLQERGLISLAHARTGKTNWKQTLPPQTFALVEGGRWPKVAKLLQKTVTLRIVSAQNGVMIRSIRLPAQRRVWIFPEGDILVALGRVLKWYRGKHPASWATPGDVVQVTQSKHVWIIRTRLYLQVFHKKTGARLFSTSSEWQVKGTERDMGKGRLLLFRKPSKFHKVGLARVIQVCLTPQ